MKDLLKKIGAILMYKYARHIHLQIGPEEKPYYYGELINPKD